MIEAVRSELEQSFGELRAVYAVSGGCISPSFRVVLRDGAQLFVKTARRNWPHDAFREEARSLDALRAADALVVPRVHGVSAQWLALEWLEPRPATAALWAELGRGLARTHRNRHASFGWCAGNYIGPLTQTNVSTSSWAEFWRAQRLGPLLRRAAGHLDEATLRDFDILFDQLDQRLDAAHEDGPSLLHGDLWSGNVHMCASGAGVIDPATYYGHREVDLAMAALFGGFPRSFMDAYEQEWALLPGASARRPVYQLYYLLVHVVLFGGGYVSGTRSALQEAIATS